MAHREYAPLDDDLVTVTAPEPVATPPVVSFAPVVSRQESLEGRPRHERTKSRAAGSLAGGAGAAASGSPPAGSSASSAITTTSLTPAVAFKPAAAAPVSFSGVSSAPTPFVPAGVTYPPVVVAVTHPTPAPASTAAVSFTARPVSFAKPVGAAPIAFAPAKSAPLFSPVSSGASPMGFRVAPVATAAPISFGRFDEARTPRGSSIAPIQFPSTPTGGASTFSVFPPSPTNPFGHPSSPRAFGAGSSLPPSHPSDFPTGPGGGHDFPTSHPSDFPSTASPFPTDSPFGDPLSTPPLASLFPTTVSDESVFPSSSSSMASVPGGLSLSIGSGAPAPGGGECSHGQVFRLTYAPAKAGLRKIYFPNGHTYADKEVPPLPKLGIKGLSQVNRDGIMMEGGRLDMSVCLDCHRIINFDPRDVINLQQGYEKSSTGTEPQPPPPPAPLEKKVTIEVKDPIDERTRARVGSVGSGVEGFPAPLSRLASGRSRVSVSEGAPPATISFAPAPGSAAPTPLVAAPGSGGGSRSGSSGSTGAGAGAAAAAAAAAAAPAAGGGGGGASPPTPTPISIAPPSSRATRAEARTETSAERSRRASTTSAPPGASSSSSASGSSASAGASTTTAPGTAAPTAPGKKVEPNHAQYVLGYGMIDFSKDPNYADRDFNEEESVRELKSMIVTNDLNETAFND